jgi:hypothetical protein
VGTGGFMGTGGFTGTGGASGTGGSAGSGGISMMFVGADKCDTATAVALGDGPTRLRLQANMTGAAKERDAPCGTTGVDIYFSFTLLRKSLVYADTFGSSMNTVVHFTSSCMGTPLPPGAGMQTCSDDACGTPQSQAAAILPIGTHYLVVSGPAGASGEVLVNFERALVGHQQQLPLAQGPSTLNGITDGSGNVLQCQAAGPENSYWWTTCPSFPGGPLMSSTCTGTAFDTVLTLQTPRNGAVSCGDDNCNVQSILNATLPAGAGANVLSVGGTTLQNKGPYTLTVNRP